MRAWRPNGRLRATAPKHTVHSGGYIHWENSKEWAQTRWQPPLVWWLFATSNTSIDRQTSDGPKKIGWACYRHPLYSLPKDLVEETQLRHLSKSRKGVWKGQSQADVNCLTSVQLSWLITTPWIYFWSNNTETGNHFKSLFYQVKMESINCGFLIVNIFQFNILVSWV